MRIFSKTFEKIQQLASHRHAPWYLAALSVTESAFFVCPPDVMLLPMALAKPDRAWWYAGITTIGSVLGGLLGYLIGHYLMHFVLPFIEQLGYAEAYGQVQQWFIAWGFAALFVAGFSPVPYKLFTIGAGAIRMQLLPFVAASILGRGLRFFLGAAAMRWGGARFEQTVHRYIDQVGWALVFLLIIGYLVIRYT